jgi:hypothetical protein
MISPMGQPLRCGLDAGHGEESVSEAAAHEIQARAALNAALELFVDGETFSANRVRPSG